MYFDNIGEPLNSFGIGYYGNPLLANRDFQHDMFGGFSSELEVDNGSNVEFSSTSRRDPISVIGQSTSSVEKVDQANESENNVEIENEQSNLNTWYSEFEEMKNAERNKVNNFHFIPRYTIISLLYKII